MPHSTIGKSQFCRADDIPKNENGAPAILVGRTLSRVSLEVRVDHSYPIENLGRTRITIESAAM
jgi:hypothetical protein